MSSTSTSFTADAVLFDMDGTLTDSIAAVEAAWGKVALDIGQDPEFVIAATHGKRATDNLARFKSHIKAHEMDDEVEEFENTILFFADAYNKHGPGSQTNSPLGSGPPCSPAETTPELSPNSSMPSSSNGSRASSFAEGDDIHRPSLLTRVSSILANTVRIPENESAVFDDLVMEGQGQEHLAADEVKLQQHMMEAWQIEACIVDRSVQILPGVKRMIDSIPDGRYAVATSGAKTYAYGCMTRVGITPPPVTITADDKRLKAGKPAPDPFLLAAKCLGYNATNCVVFEDSPSGIRAGVASGATVIAVCTSHERSKIEDCGAHYIVENMEKVECEAVGTGADMKLLFTVMA